jgi:hypothetical protein
MTITSALDLDVSKKNASENSIARISINCELFLWGLVYTAWSRYFQLAGEFVAHQVM